ncbi:MAG: NADH-quinone oxidoreductase subunit N [candidate division GAL15 bacterium]
MNWQDLRWLVPELVLTGAAVALLLADLMTAPDRRRQLGWFAVAAAVPAAAACGQLLAELQALRSGGVRIFADTYTVDPFALYVKLVALGAVALVALVSLDYFPGRTPHVGEAFALLLFAGVGLLLMASASDLILLLLSIEFVSLSSYLLAGFLKRDPKSNEAGVKYFLYGAATTGVMAYGFSLLYGLAGSTSLYDVATRLGRAGGAAYLAVGMALAGFGFKVSMVPFHQWTPDVYEGAPTPITAFLSVGPKAAGFAALVRTLSVGIPLEQVQWPLLLAGLSALTMTVGNLLALLQRNLKRMLAYSSIAHAGYVLMALAAWKSAWALPGLLYYLLAYLFMNLGAFFVALVASEATGSDEIPDHAGLSQRAPWVAAAMVVFMLSLTGIPPTAGFFGKFYLFAAAVDAGLLWLAALAVANSVVSLYYYVGVLRALYLMPPPERTPLSVSPALRVGLGVALVGTVAVGLYPQPVVGFVELARRLLGG